MYPKVCALSSSLPQARLTDSLTYCPHEFNWLRRRRERGLGEIDGMGVAGQATTDDRFDGTRGWHLGADPPSVPCCLVDVSVSLSPFLTILYNRCHTHICHCHHMCPLFRLSRLTLHNSSFARLEFVPQQWRGGIDKFLSLPLSLPSCSVLL